MKCQRIYTSRETQEQVVCEKRAEYIAWNDTLLCNECVHALFEDEPIESFESNVRKLDDSVAEHMQAANKRGLFNAKTV